MLCSLFLGLLCLDSLPFCRPCLLTIVQLMPSMAALTIFYFVSVTHVMCSFQFFLWAGTVFVRLSICSFMQQVLLGVHLFIQQMVTEVQLLCQALCQVLGVGWKLGFSHKEDSLIPAALELIVQWRIHVRQSITQMITIVKSVINEKYRVLWRMCNVGLNQFEKEDESQNIL